MQIFVKTLKGSTVALETKPSDTVDHVLTLLEHATQPEDWERGAMPPHDCLYLVGYGMSRLRDASRTLEEYCICQEGYMLQLVLRSGCAPWPDRGFDVGVCFIHCVGGADFNSWCDSAWLSVTRSGKSADDDVTHSIMLDDPFRKVSAPGTQART
jgi:hypothetical protein